MAISRRLRFEILRRDGHTCRYCGAMAPDVPLTVDHVIPTTLGGADEPANLVTACQPCNAGKSSMPADAAIVEDVEADALRWKAAIEQAALEMRAEQETMDALVAQFREAWASWKMDDGSYIVALPGDWRSTIEQLLSAGCPIEHVIKSVDTAMAARQVKIQNVWRYFCGCCWRRVTDMQESARRIIESENA